MLPETQRQELNGAPSPGRDRVEPAGTLRVRFAKTGMLRFISHLDLLRTMKSALIRARVPVWYTEGFNPHPKLVFALPLSLGAESVCELLDVRIARRVDPDGTLADLQNALPADLRPVEAYYPDHKFTEICWASYTLALPDGVEPDLSRLDAPQLTVLKRTKSGEKESDIKPQIRRAALTFDGKLELTLRAAVNDFLNPELAARALGVDAPRVTRTGVFFNDGRVFR